MNHLSASDYSVFFVYFIVVSTYGYWVYRSKKSKTINSKDYFLAEGSLTWWAIGTFIIASNISAEHFIGMSGSGFAMGLAIVMIVITLVSRKQEAKDFKLEIDNNMFRLKPVFYCSLSLIVGILTALYTVFW